MPEAGRRILFILLLILFCTSLCLGTIFATYSSIPNCADKTSDTDGLPIYSFLINIRSFDVITLGNRQLKPAQTYVVAGDGRWYGNATLLFINRSDAIFLIEYPGKEKSNFCIWHAAKAQYSQ